VAFAPALTRRLATHADLSLVVRQAPADCDLSQLRSGEVDVVVTVDWEATPADGGFTRVRLYRDALVLAVPPDHRLADPAEPLDAAALRAENWISLPDPGPMRRSLDRLLGGDPADAVRWEFEGLAMIVQLVAHGAGIALVPHIALVGDRRRVAVRELPPPPPAFDVFAIVRATGLRNPAVAATVAALRQAAAEVRGPALGYARLY